MPRTRVINDDGQQAVLLPDGYGFKQSEVYVRRDASAGDVILSANPPTWQSFLELADRVDASCLVRDADLPAEDREG